MENLAPRTDTVPILGWNRIPFGSRTEQRLAEALDQTNVLFFPNCWARVGSGPRRQTRRLDFLVVENGTCAILEVDGAPYHPPARAAEDYARDRLFRQHGITIIDRYDAEQVWDEPYKVVAEFLMLLGRHSS